MLLAHYMRQQHENEETCASENSKEAIMITVRNTFFAFLLFLSFFSCDDGDSSSSDSPAIAPGAPRTIAVTPSVSFVVKYCPGGTIPVTPEDSGSAMVRDFWIGETEVTYKVWDAVYQWAIYHGYTFAHPGTMGDGTGDTGQHPVTTISWRDAMIWCNAVSEMCGLKPVYYIDNQLTLPRNTSTADPVFNVYSASEDQPFTVDDNDGFRLPLILEWECAARYIGETNPGWGIELDGVYWTPGNFGSGAEDDKDNHVASSLVAWWQENSGNSTHPVRQLKPNALGLYDMSGNVSEHCFNLRVYNVSDNPNYFRLLAGGSYNDHEATNAYDLCVVGAAFYASPWVVDPRLGFRIVMTR